MKEQVPGELQARQTAAKVTPDGRRLIRDSSSDIRNSLSRNSSVSGSTPERRRPPARAGRSTAHEGPGVPRGGVEVYKNMEDRQSATLPPGWRAYHSAQKPAGLAGLAAMWRKARAAPNPRSAGYPMETYRKHMKTYRKLMRTYRKQMKTYRKPIKTYRKHMKTYTTMTSSITLYGQALYPCWDNRKGYPLAEFKKAFIFSIAF